MRAALNLVAVWMVLSVVTTAQEPRTQPSDALRHPGWNFGMDVFGGVPLMKTPWIPDEPMRNAFDTGVMLRFGRVVTHERGGHWRRGTLEWGFVIVPATVYFTGGHAYYTGGAELFTPRWNFTRNRKRVVPFVGVAGGMVFGTQKFPPGRTANQNFTVAIESGAHIFEKKKHSVDVTTRLFHISNAGTGHYNPGVPLSLQIMLGYTWY